MWTLIGKKVNWEERSTKRREEKIREKEKDRKRE